MTKEKSCRVSSSWGAPLSKQPRRSRGERFLEKWLFCLHCGCGITMIPHARDSCPIQGAESSCPFGRNWSFFCFFCFFFFFWVFSRKWGLFFCTCHPQFSKLSKITTHWGKFFCESHEFIYFILFFAGGGVSSSWCSTCYTDLRQSVFHSRSSSVDFKLQTPVPSGVDVLLSATKVPRHIWFSIRKEDPFKGAGSLACSVSHWLAVSTWVRHLYTRGTHFSPVCLCSPHFSSVPLHVFWLKLTSIFLWTIRRDRIGFPIQQKDKWSQLTVPLWKTTPSLAHMQLHAREHSFSY